MRIPGIAYIQGRNYYTNPAGRHYGWAVHATASTATARQEADYATRRTDSIGSHLYTDRIEVIQSIDTIYKVNHSGSSNGNNYANCLEQTGLNSWTRQQWLDNINWTQQAYALATVIRAELSGFQVRRASVAEMKANPQVMAFYSHDDMRQAWGGTTHTDPGPNYPWDRLFDSVNAALGNGDDGDMDAQERSWLFRAASFAGAAAAGSDTAGAMDEAGVITEVDMRPYWARVAAELTPAQIEAIAAEVAKQINTGGVALTPSATTGVAVAVADETHRRMAPS